MKIPDVLFVKHCPNLSPERKIFLSKHINNRVPIDDVRWVEDYNHTDTFVWWLNKKLNLPYGVKLTSNMVKSIMMWKTMVDENIESAILIDDDVVFHKDWVSIFESLPGNDVIFMNLGLCLFYDIEPVKRGIYNIPNNAGCEGMYCTLEFAKGIMKNLNIQQAADIVIHGYLASINKPLLCSPICHQTSGIENDVTLDHESRDGMAANWVQFINNYKTLPKLDFEELFKEFDAFKVRKEAIESKFLEIYGKKVELKHYDYITKNGEHNSDLLTFH